VSPDVPFAGDILSDDIARTETGPLQSKSYHARHLLRVSLRDPPRERAGGHRPEGVFGVSPARRMRCDLIAPTGPEKPVT